MGLGNRTFTRRSTLEGIAVGAFGLAGAALLGCGTKSKTVAPGPTVAGTVRVTSATGVEVLPLTAPVAQGTPRKGGMFAENIGATTWQQHDSHTQLGASEWHVISEKTIELHPITAQLLPSVAASWEVADPQGLTLIFHIHPGMKIHNVPPWNGREFNAEDVAWNLERIGGLYADRLKIPLSAFQRAAMVQNITHATAVDPYTVKVTLSKPNSSFFNGVGENRTMLMPKEMDDIGYNDPMKFAGVGPFQMAEFTKDVRERFTRFDGYAGFRPNEPSFDELDMLVIPDTASAIAAFSSGQIHLLSVTSPSDLQTLQKAKPDALLYSWIDTNWNHLRPGMAYQPFQDFRVRRAIFLSIDYAAIGNAVYGTGWGYQGPLSPAYPEAWKPDKLRTLPGFNPDTKAQDRADAAKLLAAAGYPGGAGLDFDIIHSPVLGISITTLFQGQMQSLYPDMKVTDHQLPDSATFATQQAAGNFKMLQYGITCSPDAVLEMIGNYHTGGSRNYGRFSDPNLDQILDKAIGELNPNTRTQLLDDFQSRWFSDWTANFILHADAARDIVQGNVGGVDKSAGSWWGYSWWTKVARWFYLNK